MEKVINELKRINFIDFAFLHIENELIVRQFYGACKNSETLNEFYSLEESSQIGTQLTAQISHCFYTFLKYDSNDFLEKNNSFLRVFTGRENNQTKSYDLVFIDIITGIKYYLEIKLSQNENSWQGSTSSTSKVDNFLLINFRMNRDKKLSLNENNGLFSGIFVGIFNLGQHKWNGDAKSNSHRTSFDFRMSDWSIDYLTESCIIKGGMTPKMKIYHLKLDNINYETIK
jgi:hypothetical protein